MRKGIVAFVCLLLIATLSFGQNVTNARFEQAENLVKIYYTLDKPADVELQISVDGGSYRTIQKGLSGDVGKNVKSGNNTVVYNPFEDVGEIKSNVVRFRIAATVKSAGTATITATTSNGKTAQCVVTVKEKQVKSIVLNKTSQTIWPGGTFALEAKVSPYDAANKTVEFRSSNENVASVNSKGVVKAKSNGTATITATTSNGKSASCAVTISDKSMVNIGGTVSGATLWQLDESLLFYYTLDKFSKVRFYKSVDGGNWKLIEKGVVGVEKNIRKGRRSLVYTANDITPGRVRFAIVGERIKSCMLSLGGFYSLNNDGGVMMRLGFKMFYMGLKTNFRFPSGCYTYNHGFDEDLDLKTGKISRLSATVGCNWFWRKKLSFNTGLSYGVRKFTIEHDNKTYKIDENSTNGLEFECGLNWFCLKSIGIHAGYSILSRYSEFSTGLIFKF